MKLIRGEGIGQDARGPQSRHLVQDFRIRLPRYHQHRQFGPFGFEAFQGLDAVQFGHVNVEDQSGIGLLAQQAQHVQPVRGEIAGIAAHAAIFAQQFPGSGIVVGDEQAAQGGGSGFG
jgi:hypothetical protein